MNATTTPRSFTLVRDTDLVWTIKSPSVYWSDGSKLSERVAFDSTGRLSNIAAQSVDRSNGLKYLLVSPFAVSNQTLLDSARSLSVGQSIEVSL